MKRALLTGLGFLLFLVIFSTYSFAATLTESMSEKYSAKKDICPVVKSSIQEGMDTKEVVKTAIVLGHSACFVIKCSLDAGGALEKTVTGAIEAGATTDVISRCALEAGAKPEDVAKVMDDPSGLGYTPPPGGPSPITIGFPGGGRGGGAFVSPSGFR